MLISLTVGKVDAGVAVLLTDDKRLIEFPSILLPPSITTGSIVDITVRPNPTLEHSNTERFRSLQSNILNTYGLQSPSPPDLSLRNATQTSIVLEWAPLSLATATYRSLTLYRNNAKAGTIPRFSSTNTNTPRDNNNNGNPPTRDPVLATKVSGLAIDTPYTFHLILRTSAGTYTSNKLSVRTQKMTDLTGITVTPGPMPPQLKPALLAAVERIGAKVAESVRIDTTHFVCMEGRGREWERAVEMNVPVVRPEWVDGCEREGRIVGVRAYYLGADPKLRNVGQGVGMRGSGAGAGGAGGMQSPVTPAQTPQLGHDSQVSLPSRERAMGESQTSLASESVAEGGLGVPADKAGERPTTPVTPWPPNMGQARREEEDDDDDDEVSSEEGEQAGRPVVPAKDGPSRVDENDARDAQQSRVSDVSSTESESGAGDIGRGNAARDSGAVSPEEEGPGGREKPVLGREESQGNLSDVEL